jgi:ergothioneine biosynthesis protein EgtB
MTETMGIARQSRQDGDCLSELRSRYEYVRRFSEQIAQPLSAEDCAIQSMPDVSPTRWHLAHTTWFFETFLLKTSPGYEVFDKSFEYLFNSYYNSIGEQFPRSRRGLISRPGLDETLKYRRHVDRAMADWMRASDMTPQQLDVLTIGLCHEQQHQELMLTDIKHVLSCNPLAPVYRIDDANRQSPSELSWISMDEDLAWIGNDSSGFAFDNERPKHRFFLNPYRIASHCVTNGEYQAFIEDGGYDRPELWLSLGWDIVKAQDWTAPLYWSRSDGPWLQFTLGGCKPINADEPVCHVSFFEADAYARWAGCRLPTEQEWEHAVCSEIGTPDGDLSGHWSDSLLHAGRTIQPQISKGDAEGSRLVNAIGNLWQWTSSQYSAFPGYRPPRGALGEYNGKFMCNQFVLRGGSCASPSGHIRTTYRNFFPPDARWQFATIRLAK